MMNKIKSPENKFHYLTEKYDLGENVNVEEIVNEYNHLSVNTTSLGIKILSICGGILATIFFIAFLALGGFILDYAILTIIFGATFIIAGIALNKKSNNLILDTFGIGVFCTGYTLLIYGLIDTFEQVNITAALVCILSLMSMYFVRGYLFNFINALIFFGAFCAIFLPQQNETFVWHIISFILGSSLLAVFIFESHLLAFFRKYSYLYEPIKVALIVLNLILIIFLSSSQVQGFSDHNFWWIYAIIPIITIIFILNRLHQRFTIPLSLEQICIYTIVTLILALSSQTPFILMSVAVLMLCFYVQFRFGFILSIIVLIFTISKYYYDMDRSLLDKSIILMILGLVLLLLYFFTLKPSPTHEK